MLSQPSLMRNRGGSSQASGQTRSRHIGHIVHTLCEQSIRQIITGKKLHLMYKFVQKYWLILAKCWEKAMVYWWQHSYLLTIIIAMMPSANKNTLRIYIFWKAISETALKETNGYIVYFKNIKYCKLYATIMTFLSTSITAPLNFCKASPLHHFSRIWVPKDIWFSEIAENIDSTYCMVLSELKVFQSFVWEYNLTLYIYWLVGCQYFKNKVFFLADLFWQTLALEKLWLS